MNLVISMWAILFSLSCPALVASMDQKIAVRYPKNPAERRANGNVRTITTVLNPPFVMEKTKFHKNGTLRKMQGSAYEGFCIDLIASLARTAGFAYELKLVADGKYGSLEPNGKWNGMVGEVLRGDADLAVAPLTITRERQRVVDFTTPFMTAGISIMIKKPNVTHLFDISFVSPFPWEIWMGLLGAYLCASVVIYFVAHINRRCGNDAESTESNYFTFTNTLWFAVMGWAQQGADITPRPISARIASACWWFFTLLFVCTYTANLVSLLTQERKAELINAPIKNVEELAEQTEVKYGLQAGGSTAMFFKNSNLEIYRRMWNFMSAQKPSVFTATYAEGIDRVRSSKGRYAFLLESPTNEYVNSRNPCDTMQIGKLLNSVGFGIAAQRGSKLRDSLNLGLLELQETGVINSLQHKWWHARGDCLGDYGAPKMTRGIMDTNRMIPLFFLLLSGLVASLIVGVLEMVVKSFFKAKQDKTTTKAVVQERRHLMKENQVNVG